jgi:hypothetical protein
MLCFPSAWLRITVICHWTLLQARFLSFSYYCSAPLKSSTIGAYNLRLFSNTYSENLYVYPGTHLWFAHPCRTKRSLALSLYLFQTGLSCLHWYHQTYSICGIQVSPQDWIYIWSGIQITFNHNRYCHRVDLTSSVHLGRFFEREIFVRKASVLHGNLSLLKWRVFVLQNVNEDRWLCMPISTGVLLRVHAIVPKDILRNWQCPS